MANHVRFIDDHCVDSEEIRSEMQRDIDRLVNQLEDQEKSTRTSQSLQSQVQRLEGKWLRRRAPRLAHTHTVAFRFFVGKQLADQQCVSGRFCTLFWSGFYILTWTLISTSLRVLESLAVCWETFFKRKLHSEFSLANIALNILWKLNFVQLKTPHQKFTLK